MDFAPPDADTRQSARHSHCAAGRWLSVAPLAFLPTLNTLQAGFKCVTVIQMPHPVHIMPGTISLPFHVSMTESVDVIERYQINFLRQQTGSHVHSRSNNGLFECTILRVGKRLMHHRA